MGACTSHARPASLCAATPLAARRSTRGQPHPVGVGSRVPWGALTGGRPPAPRGAAVRPEAVLVSAKRLPRDWGIMPRQCAGRGGQWAGSSARTHG